MAQEVHARARARMVVKPPVSIGNSELQAPGRRAVRQLNDPRRHRHEGNDQTGGGDAVGRGGSIVCAGEACVGGQTGVHRGAALGDDFKQDLDDMLLFATDGLTDVAVGISGRAASYPREACQQVQELDGEESAEEGEHGADIDGIENRIAMSWMVFLG